MLSSMAQPTIRRENKSMTTARYSQPSKRPDVSDIRRPDLVGFPDRKPAVQEIGGHGKIMAAVGGYPVSPGSLDAQTQLPHQAARLVAADGKALILQTASQTTRTVTGSGLLKEKPRPGLEPLLKPIPTALSPTAMHKR